MRIKKGYYVSNIKINININFNFRKSIFLTISTLVIFFISTNFIFGQKIYYVSPDGSNLSNGDFNSPLKSIQYAIDKASSGDIIYIRQGVFRESVQINSNKNGLSLLAYPGEKAVLKGSEIITNWISHKDFWKKFVDIQPQQVMVNGDNPLQQIGYPNADFKTNQSYPRYEFPIGSGLIDMSSGRFFWQNDTLYIKLKNDENPNIQTIEISQLRGILNIDAANVHIKGLYFRHTNSNTFEEFGYAITLGDNSILEDCDIEWCDFGGVTLGYFKTGAKVINCILSNNGAQGINSNASFNFLVSHCLVNHNNYRNFYAQWHAGGFKASNSSWGIIENSVFGFNIGPGIWFDQCYENSVYRTDGQKSIIIRNNYIHHNSKTSNKNSAVMIEVSDNVNLQNNLVINNDYRGIYIASSWNCNILNNVVAYTQLYHGIDIHGMPRAGAKLVNNYVANNILYNNNTEDDIEILNDNGSDVTNNMSDYNLIFRETGGVKLRYGSTTFTSIDAWRKNVPYTDHSFSTNPQIIDTLFHLSSDSPAINAGTGAIAEIPEKDFDGNNRLMGCKVDIGAYESLFGELTKDHDASLKSLNVNLGNLSPQFSPCEFNYVNSFQPELAVIPVITAQPSNSLARIEILDPINIHSTIESDRTAFIIVTSKDGIGSYKYKITFSILDSNIIPKKDYNIFNVFPNPTLGLISYKLSTYKGDLSIKIINLTGIAIKEFTIGNFIQEGTLDLSFLKSGFYVIEVKTLDSLYIAKIFKIR